MRYNVEKNGFNLTKLNFVIDTQCANERIDEQTRKIYTITHPILTALQKNPKLSSKSFNKFYVLLYTTKNIHYNTSNLYGLTEIP